MISIIETISAVIILGIALLFLNPGHLAMPDTMVSMLVVGLIVAFLVFAGFLLREKPADEREAFHIKTAGRISYLVGVAVLVFGIVVQGIQHNIDPWLVIALCAMVLTKLLSRIYSRFKM
ncbi:MAG TPA: hypothetical protein VLF20_05010 [Patescibacteria group bacterium]|nr:hypothetical protein [Patescibacteria group bacterium]